MTTQMPLAAALLAAVLAACSPAGPTPAPSAAGESAQPAAPTATASASPSPAPTAADEPLPSGGDATADAFWATVRRGLAEGGHLIVTADGAAPVVVRYLPDAAEALVAGELVSRCVRNRSWAGGGGALAPVPGAWLCGADALVAGFRATAAPIDAWSPDFPAEGSPEEAVMTRADGSWIWTYTVADGLEGPLLATLALDPASGRIIEGNRQDDSGTTTWTFDYATPVAPIAAP